AASGRAGHQLLLSHTRRDLHGRLRSPAPTVLLRMRCIRNRLSAAHAGAYRVRLRALTLVGIAGFGLAVWLFLIVNHVVPAPWTLILMGRTSATAGTLTGRIPLWEMLLQFAAQHPVLGYGYNSFMGPKHAAQIIAVIWWGFNSAHSAYIATLLDLGAIGLVVLIAVLVLSTRRAMSLFRVYRDPTIAFFAALLV